MSDSTTYNLLTGTATGDASKWKVGVGWDGASITSDAVDGHQCIIHEVPHGWQVMYQPLPSNLAGKLVTLSGYAKITSKSENTKQVRFGANNLNEYYVPDTDISDSWTMIGDTFTLSETPMLSITTGPIPEGDGTAATVAYRELMLVEGTTPAAWAPAEGESLAGGGASMSANLWKAENVISAEALEDGIYTCSGIRGVRTNMALDRLTSNQTFHCGFSVNPGADDAFFLSLRYIDAAGNVNYASTPTASAPAGKWTRVSGSAVVPSGMTVCQMVICNNSNASGESGWKVTNPTLSLGSPVCLASSAHTPYATQDYVAAEYATKAALKVTSDALAGTASEVSALGTRMDDAESSIAELAKRLPIYYYTDVPSESSITEKPQLAVIKGGAVYLVE